MPSNSSTQNRASLEPQREVGRRRIALLMQAADDVFYERGFEAATMAEIAARADTRIGSLYRFFPNKNAVAEALMRHHTELLALEYEDIRLQAAEIGPEALADLLIELFIKLYPQIRALTVLIDAHADQSAVQRNFRRDVLAGIRAALAACAPTLPEEDAEHIAVVVLNNMKTLVGMIKNDAPTSKNAPDELRLMNRIYLGVKLGTLRVERIPPAG